MMEESKSGRTKNLRIRLEKISVVDPDAIFLPDRRPDRLFYNEKNLSNFCKMVPINYSRISLEQLAACYT
jgi:hypothetical protein